MLQLCDQINRQSFNSDQSQNTANIPPPTSTAFITNNVPLPPQAQIPQSQPNFQMQTTFQPQPQIVGK